MDPALCLFGLPSGDNGRRTARREANKRGNQQEDEEDEEEEKEEDVDDVVAVGSRPQRRGLSHTQRTLAVSTNGRIKLFHPFQRCCIF